MPGTKLLTLAAALIMLAACSTLPGKPDPGRAETAKPLESAANPADAGTNPAIAAVETAEPPRTAGRPAVETAGAAVFPVPAAPEIASVNEPAFPGENPFFPELILPEYTIPGTGTVIMGEGRISPEKLSSFLLSINSGADPEFIRKLSFYYTEEAAAEGINHDVAFAQMCLETGFLRYGGLVTPDMNNFCGLGAIGPAEPGERFPSPLIGVRAHIQHLKAYASDTPLANELVDPRYRFVRRGSAPHIRLLSGTWAADKSYAEKIETILKRLYEYAE
jgi:hypothetical protein